MYGDFLLLERDDQAPTRAERLAFGETSGRDEKWLRDTLFMHPELLPVRDIDPAYYPLIPLCRELRTAAGPLDVAYINPHGRLTLVECKLWRNPEARRKVVSQVLDYARAISDWSFSDLQRQVSASTGIKGNSPLELARSHEPSLVEHRFIDDVTKSIRGGKFLLIIAGDGIREDVAGLTDLINRNAASGFSFGLVEVGLYGFEDGRILVQPRTVAKTSIIERTVILVRERDGAPLLGIDDLQGEPLSSDVPDPLNESPRQAEYRAWWSPVMQMRFDDPDQESPRLYWPNHVRTAMPARRTWLTAYRYGGETGSLGVYLTGSGEYYVSLMQKLMPHRDEILSELPDGSQLDAVNLPGVQCFITQRPINSFHDSDAQRAWIMEVLNIYVNVLRPRIKALVLAG